MEGMRTLDGHGYHDEHWWLMGWEKDYSKAPIEERLRPKGLFQPRK